MLAAVLTLMLVLEGGCGWVRHHLPGGTGHAARGAVELSPLAKELLQKCPKPGWWDDVKVPEVHTYSELLKYWQTQAFTPEQLFKVCYRAILEHVNENPPDMAMLATSLISHGDPTYRHYPELYGFMLDHFFAYDRPLARYGGKAGDTVAGIAEDYARILIGMGREAEARDILERLLRERKAEINPQMLQLLSLQLADAYIGLAQPSKARAVLTQALTYPGDWDKQIRQKLDSL